MNILILGCGRLGGLAAESLIAAGHRVLGIRREPRLRPAGAMHRPQAGACAPGDASDPALWDGLGTDWQAVLLCATPGLRRGRDHGLDRAATLVHQRLPQARLVYTGTTAVYGDAAGAAVAEDGPLAPEAGPLLAIERTVLEQPDALVLRLPALVGAGRDRAMRRAREAVGSLVVPGDPERPFSIIHEADAAEIAVEALVGVLATRRGILNAAAPTSLSVRDYYAQAAARAGVAVAITGDAGKPSRSIDAARLHALLPGRTWRGAWD